LPLLINEINLRNLILIRNYCNQSDLTNSDCMSDIQHIYSVIHMCVKLLNILHIMVFSLNKKIKKLIYSQRYFKKINIQQFSRYLRYYYPR